MSEKPQPRQSSDTEPFWTACNEGRFLLRRCANCGTHRLYPRDACPECWETEAEDVEASGEGTVVSYSVAHRPKDESFAADAPYVVAVVELAEGVTVLTNVVDCDPEEVNVGDPVELIWTDRGGQELYQFVLA